MERIAQWIAVISSLLLLGEKVLPVPFLTQLSTVLFLALVVFVILRVPAKWLSIRIRIPVTVVAILVLGWMALPAFLDHQKLRVEIVDCDRLIRSKQLTTKRICLLNQSGETVRGVEVALKNIDPLPEQWFALNEIRFHYMEDDEQYTLEGIIFPDFTPTPKDLRPGSTPKAVDIVQFQSGRPNEIRIYHTASSKAFPPFVKRQDYCLILEISGHNTRSIEQAVWVGFVEKQFVMRGVDQCSLPGADAL